MVTHNSKSDLPEEELSRTPEPFFGKQVLSTESAANSATEASASAQLAVLSLLSSLHSLRLAYSVCNN